MNKLLEKKKDVINVLKLRRIRYQLKKEHKIYRLPKSVSIDLIEQEETCAMKSSLS